MIPTGRREGTALVLALLVVVGASLITSALLHVSGRQTIIAGLAADVARARADAESAARAAAAGWWTADMLDMEPAETRPAPPIGAPISGAEASVQIQRLNADHFLIRAGTSTRGGGASGRAGLLVRSLNPAEIWRAFGATLTAAGPVEMGPDALLSALESGPPAIWDAGICDGAVEAARDVFGDSARPALVVAGPEDALLELGAELQGEPELLVDPRWVERAASGLGPLAIDHVAPAAERQERGPLRLGPVLDGGACDAAAAANWGDPLQPAAACGDYVPLVHADGDLQILNGAGQAVLVVEGDLRLEDGARLFGPVLVTGNLRIEADAEVHGAVRALGPGPHRIEGRIIRSDCALHRALERSHGLNRAFATGSRQWVPVF